MRIPDLVTRMMPRAQRLQLTDSATGFYDPDEVEEYVLVALRYLSNRWDLLHFFRLNRNLFLTASGIEAYTLPDSYGFVVPEEPDKSGLAVTDTTGNSPRDLRWYPPQQYELLRSSSTGRPIRFTLAENQLYLQPTPDAAYWVQAIEREEIDSTYDIPDAYLDVVTAETLWRMATDLDKPTQALLDERTQSTRTMVNREARLKTRFQNATYTRDLRSRRRRGRR